MPLCVLSRRGLHRNKASEVANKTRTNTNHVLKAQIPRGKWQPKRGTWMIVRCGIDPKAREAVGVLQQRCQTDNTGKTKQTQSTAGKTVRSMFGGQLTGHSFSEQVRLPRAKKSTGDTWKEGRQRLYYFQFNAVGSVVVAAAHEADDIYLNHIVPPWRENVQLIYNNSVVRTNEPLGQKWYRG